MAGWPFCSRTIFSWRSFVVETLDTWDADTNHVLVAKKNCSKADWFAGSGRFAHV